MAARDGDEIKEAMMGRKVALTAVAVSVVVLSVVLVGGQVGGGGFLWWGNRDPIYIYGDSGFTIENGVMCGSGTADDPYIIEGWRIDSPRADYGIYVDHTTAHFVIRDCVIERARHAGIYFNTVRNGHVVGTQIGLSDTAVYFLDCTENVLVGNVIADSRYGVVMGANSRGNCIVGNAFLENGMNAYDPYRWNAWFEPCRGNFWSDYEGRDRDGDGIGDVAYYHVYDRYPLIDPPAAWTRVAPAGPSLSGNRVSPEGALIVTSETPIALSAIDPGSGVAQIYYKIDEGEWISYGGPIYLVGEDGPRRLTYYGLDHLGNAEPKQTVSLVLDNHPPRTVLEVGEPTYVDARGTWITSKSPIALRLVAGSTYGETRIYYDIDGYGWRLYSKPFAIEGADGPRRVTFYGRSASGVTEELQSIVLYKDDAAPSTRGGRASSSVAVQVGGPVEEAPPTIPPAEEVAPPPAEPETDEAIGSTPVLKGPSADGETVQTGSSTLGDAETREDSSESTSEPPVEGSEF